MFSHNSNLSAMKYALFHALTIIMSHNKVTTRKIEYGNSSLVHFEQAPLLLPTQNWLQISQHGFMVFDGEEIFAVSRGMNNEIDAELDRLLQFTPVVSAMQRQMVA